MSVDVKYYLALASRRLPWFVLFLALGTALGVTLASVLPPVYVAQARLLVESEQIPGDLAASTVQTQATEQLQIIQQRILTRANLLELANRLQIYGPIGDPRKRMGADETLEDMRKRITIAVTGGPSTRGPAQATLVTVSFEAPTGQMSALVTNELVTMILNENVRLRTGVAGQTLEFFTQEVERLDKELALRGARILEFKNANQEALPDSLEFRRRQQAVEQERLIVLEREVAGLKERRARLVQLYESTGQVAVFDTPQTPEQRQLASLRDPLGQALAVYTPQNPRVRMLESQIAALEARIGGGGADDSGRQLSAYELQLADIDGQIAQLEDQRARVEAQLAQLRSSIEATPRNAITLDTLERDQANVRSQYDQAVANRARAQTGDTIEALSRGQRISVIEQAVAPAEPDSPNRPLVAGAGMGAGTMLGLGLIVLLEVMNRAIRRPADLGLRLGITPFATLPYIRSRGEGRRRALWIGLALVLILGGIPLGIWAIDTWYRPIDQIPGLLLRQLGLEGFGD